MISFRGKIKQDDLVVHDEFITLEEVSLFLVDRGDKMPFWASENQVSLGKLSLYWRTKEEIYFAEGCNTSKVKNMNCENKSRTKGSLLSTYNCGII